MPEHIVREEMTIYSQTKSLHTVREFVTRLVRQSRVDSKDQNKIILAVDEAVANTIEHGYDRREDGLIRVVVELDEESLKIIIQDSGVKFDPNAIKDVNMPAHVQQQKRRGLGIFLMRKIMDEVIYNFKEGERNELTLVKHYPKR